jgi:Mg-chelatase subunit ChlD/pimeloyl-ACP methyl ester carboxylesterase
MRKINRFFSSIIFILLFHLLSSAMYSQPQPIGKLISYGEESKTKIPLILIHGNHGTKDGDSLDAIGDEWQVFLNQFSKDNQPHGLNSKYSIYLFQYYSDFIGVSEIAQELGREVDRKLASRRFVMMAHSMGGLVAKSFMVNYCHKEGNWFGLSGGKTTLGLITLATPHHGTPGANDANALYRLFASWAWRRSFEKANRYYWRDSVENDKPASRSSTAPNRSDLRWDNFDRKLSADINTELLNTNKLFKLYADKVILYAGILKPIKPTENFHYPDNNHDLLTLSSGLMYYALAGNFGFNDGLVPYKSSLLCEADDSNPQSGKPPTNFECYSLFRVRRFEFNNNQSNDLPDTKTLSITRNARGFDHEEMRDDLTVLRQVRADLLDFAKKALYGPFPIKSPPVKVVAPEIPTLFLFDVSGSMAENGKIEQARAAGLKALGEMKENRRLGHDNSPVSIWVFDGDCQPSAARQILPFTNNLANAEAAMRSNIPKPGGATPLPQAIERSSSQINDYLNANQSTGSGRLVVLSDGQSTCGEIRPTGTYSQAKVIIFPKLNILTVGYDIQVGSQAERDLQYLASASGGRYFPASDGGQLSRAFEKAIRVYLPKTVAAPNGDFGRGTEAILNRDFSAALRIFTNYVQANPEDALGYYNLAVACEASELYKRAAENYRKYLSLAPEAADAGEIRARIGKTEEDYRAKLVYHADALRSDLEYLKAYYRRLFGLKNTELAAEFAGFVNEKRAVYAGLPEFLEIKTVWLRRNSEELADSLGRLSSRVNSPSFDRDAVSLLTLPIGQLEELVERLNEYNAQNFR